MAKTKKKTASKKATAQKESAKKPLPLKKPTAKKKVTRKISNTISGRSLTDIAKEGLEAALPAPEVVPDGTGGAGTDGDTGTEEISANFLLTQEDIDAHLILSMADSNTGLMSALHGLALEGKKWFQEEPEKATLFLSAAKKTATYRPAKLLFEMLELDDEIINIPPLTEHGEDSLGDFVNTLLQLGTSVSSLLNTVSQINTGINIEI